MNLTSCGLIVGREIGDFAFARRQGSQTKIAKTAIVSTDIIA
jgi:hypothetical protein